jgi:ATP-dependent phosphoenolpyruvate carboxykinase
MKGQGSSQAKRNLAVHGIRNANTVWRNLSTPVLYEHALQRHEGLLSHLARLWFVAVSTRGTRRTSVMW